jgi:hypothetical protein
MCSPVVLLELVFRPFVSLFCRPVFMLASCAVHEVLSRKTLYVKPFWEQFENERENQREREEKKWFQQGMSKCTTPQAAVKPLRFP